MGLEALSIKIYECTSELVQKISISLIEVYEKVGSQDHLCGVRSPIYKNLSIHIGTSTKYSDLSYQSL